MMLVTVESESKMNSAVLCLVLLICCSSSAQDYNVTAMQDCYPDMCQLLKDFGALEEELSSAETRLWWEENRVSQCEIRLDASETRLTAIGNTLKGYEERVVALEKRGETKVIFSAVTGGDDVALGPFDIDTTLTFRRVITNIGGAYNQYTGIFTAPVAGVYYFTLFYHAGCNHPSMLYLYRNDELVVQTHDHWAFGDGADNGGNAVFLQLQRLDQVCVVLAGGSHIWDSSYHTTFSGFLVAPMTETMNVVQFFD